MRMIKDPIASRVDVVVAVEVDAAGALRTSVSAAGLESERG